MDDPAAHDVALLTCLEFRMPDLGMLIFGGCPFQVGLNGSRKKKTAVLDSPMRHAGFPSGLLGLAVRGRLCPHLVQGQKEGKGG